MNDTPDSVRTLMRTLLMRRSGAERLCMGAEMFDAARTLVRASLGDPNGTDTSPEMKVRLFLRLYGQDFNADIRARIVARLQRSEPSSQSPGNDQCEARLRGLTK